MVEAFRSPSDRRYYTLALGALVVSAWAALAYWGASPYAELLDHGSASNAPLGILPSLAVFIFGWTLMVVAMMLPSSLPLINLFVRITQHRPRQYRLVLWLGLGYLWTWAWFGGLAVIADGALHALVETVWSIEVGASTPAALVLLVAGAYQFTPLKSACLTQCRSPYSFLVQHWRGRQPDLDAFRLGIKHGIFCVGCCWSLMLLMFAVGGIDFGWMLTLGALMAAERTSHWGRRLTRPVGLVLIVFSVLVGGGLVTFTPR